MPKGDNMKFKKAIGKIVNIIDQTAVEPYIIEKANSKTGTVDKIPIIPTFKGPYVAEMNQYL